MQAKLTIWLALPLIFATSSVLAENPDARAHESHSEMAERAVDSAGAMHGDCHNHGSSSPEQQAATQIDERRGTADNDRRKTRPSDIRRKRGPRK